MTGADFPFEIQFNNGYTKVWHSEEFCAEYRGCEIERASPADSGVFSTFASDIRFTKDRPDLVLYCGPLRNETRLALQIEGD